MIGEAGVVGLDEDGEWATGRLEIRLVHRALDDAQRIENGAVDLVLVSLPFGIDERPRREIDRLPVELSPDGAACSAGLAAPGAGGRRSGRGGRLRGLGGGGRWSRLALEQPAALRARAAKRRAQAPAGPCRCEWPWRPPRQGSPRERNGPNRMTWRLSPLARAERSPLGGLEPYPLHREDQAGLNPCPAQHRLAGGAGLVEPPAGAMDRRRLEPFALPRFRRDGEIAQRHDEEVKARLRFRLRSARSASRHATISGK